MMFLAIFSFFTQEFDIGVVTNKMDVCANLQCVGGEEVCGIRNEGKGFRLKLFQSECELSKYKCLVKDDYEYKIVSMDYCLEAFKTGPDKQTSKLISANNPCIEYDCSNTTDSNKICSIRKDGEGFRVTLFENQCQLLKYNCQNQVDFAITDLHICNSMKLPTKSNIITKNVANTNEDNTSLVALNNKVNSDSNVTDNNDEITGVNNQTITDDPDSDINESTDKNNGVMATDKIENLVVIRSSVIDFKRINESVNNFFAATHVFDLPIKEMDRSFLNGSTRRRLIKVAKPVKVFVPWVSIPKNISDDFDHTPTLSTCYHKCPRECPSTYAPVCGVPGIVAREPSLMFQNHCFMDVAQCKMFWENKSPTALSSSYVESSFLFCLGDEMNGMYRFLPLIRTLQHMGRLRKKGHFYYRFKNLKFFNNMLSKQPKFMG